MKKINEKVNIFNFEICSGIDIFMIVDSSYINFIDINHDFKLLVRLKTLNQVFYLIILIFIQILFLLLLFLKINIIKFLDIYKYL